MSTDIKDRIRAILRKAGDGNPSLEEREVALRMAQRLMLKHGLTEQDLGPEQDHRGFTEEPFFTTTTEAEYWKGQLLCNIAEFYFCDAYAQGNPDMWYANWYLMGREENIEICKMMFDFIVPQLEAAAVEAQVAFGNVWERHARAYCIATCKEMLMPDAVYESMSDDALGEFGRLRLESVVITEGEPEAAVRDIQELCEIESFNYAKKVQAYIKRKELGRGLAGARVDTWRRSFFIGAITEITERLKGLLIEETEEFGESGAALVLSERDALIRYQESIGHETEKRRSRTKLDRDGLDQGMDAGQSADLMLGKKLNMERKELNAG